MMELISVVNTAFSVARLEATIDVASEMDVDLLTGVMAVGWAYFGGSSPTPKLSRLLRLDHVTIDAEVRSTSPGVYVLDRSSASGFTVFYVGRSDTDVKQSLHSDVGEYRFFKFAYCESAKAAFEAECRLFHQHHPIDNREHPSNSQEWKCPVCPRGL